MRQLAGRLIVQKCFCTKLLNRKYYSKLSTFMSVLFCLEQLLEKYVEAKWKMTIYKW